MIPNISFRVDNPELLKYQMLNWAQQFGIFLLLDNHNNQEPNRRFDTLLAAGTLHSFTLTDTDNWDDLDRFYQQHQGQWIMAQFGYDLKNRIEKLQSNHPDPMGFPNLFAFVPAHLIIIKEQNGTVFSSDDPEKIIQDIQKIHVSNSQTQSAPTHFNTGFSKEEYVDTVKKIQQHIQRGDCYELNFCQEFYSPETQINPIQTYQKLSAISPTPFSALYKWHHKWCLSASPERFLKKQANQIISQPMKGTARRFRDNPEKDKAALEYLRNSQKEKSENVMIVDLVRNDLSRICAKGSVQVDELFGIYNFPQVHQMISTVSGVLKPETSMSTILNGCFPMGSMTGAPKKRVMELIELYEKTARGLFSGSLGYMDPEGNFDFNVIIRSIFYNAETHYLSFLTGGGITFYSDPEQEYAESLLKAEALKKALS